MPTTQTKRTLDSKRDSAYETYFGGFLTAARSLSAVVTA